jgi:predicted RNA-binding protein YlqC (UPF0109 family)
VRDLVTYIVENLVEEPERVRIQEVTRDKTEILEIKVAESDQGRLIGKQGRTIRSIRSLVSATASRTGKKATVEVLD